MAYSGAAERSSNDRDGRSWQLGSTESSRARNSSSDCNVTDIVDDYAMRRHLLHRSILRAGLRSVRTSMVFEQLRLFGVHFYCGLAS